MQVYNLAPDCEFSIVGFLQLISIIALKATCRLAGEHVNAACRRHTRTIRFKQCWSTETQGEPTSSRDVFNKINAAPDPLRAQLAKDAFRSITNMFDPRRTLVQLPVDPCHGAIVTLESLIDNRRNAFKVMRTSTDSINSIIGIKLALHDATVPGTTGKFPCIAQHVWQGGHKILHPTYCKEAQFIRVCEPDEHPRNFPERFGREQLRSIELATPTGLTMLLDLFPNLVSISYCRGAMWDRYSPRRDSDSEDDDFLYDLLGKGDVVTPMRFDYHRWCYPEQEADDESAVYFNEARIINEIEDLYFADRTFPDIQFIQLPLHVLNISAARSVFPNARSFVRGGVLVATVGYQPEDAFAERYTAEKLFISARYETQRGLKKQSPGFTESEPWITYGQTKAPFTTAAVVEIIKSTASMLVFQVGCDDELCVPKLLSDGMQLAFDAIGTVWALSTKPVMYLPKRARAVMTQRRWMDYVHIEFI